jgi:hypothetical protein
VIIIHRLYLAPTILLLAVQSAHAFNLHWLEDTAAQHFTDEDSRLLRQTVEQMLNHSNDGDRLTWKNAESGNSGSVANVGPADDKAATAPGWACTTRPNGCPAVLWTGSADWSTVAERWKTSRPCRC